jgi:hypothetical protein
VLAGAYLPLWAIDPLRPRAPSPDPRWGPPCCCVHHTVRSLPRVLPHFVPWQYFFHICAENGPNPHNWLSGHTIASRKSWALHLAPDEGSKRGLAGKVVPNSELCLTLAMSLRVLLPCFSSPVSGGTPTVRTRRRGECQKKRRRRGEVTHFEALITEGLTRELFLGTFFTQRNQPLWACFDEI